MSNSYPPGGPGQGPGGPQTPGGFGQPSGPGFGQQPSGQNTPGSYGPPGQQPQSYPTPSGPPSSQPSAGSPWGPGNQPSGPPSYGQGQPSAPSAPSYGGPGGPGQPGGPGGPGQPQYGGPGGPPSGLGGPGTSKPAGGKGKLIAIIGGAVALLLILMLVLSQTLFKGKPTTGETTGPGQTQQAPASTAAAAVKGYLEALAAGNAEGALSYAEVDPANKTFLTNEILQAAIKDSPITAINVPDSSSSSTYQMVAASYKLGDRTVNDEITAIKVGDVWKLKDVAAELNFTYLSNGDLPVLLNGTKVDADKIYVFPGKYKATTGSKYVDYGNAVITVDSPSSYPSTSDIRAQLSKDGKNAIIAAAKKKLSDCLKVREFSPKGCGFGLRPPGGVKMDKKSIRWTISSGANALNKLDPRLDYSDPTEATAYMYISIKGNAKATNGSRYVGTTSITGLTANLGETVTVTFR